MIYSRFDNGYSYFLTEVLDVSISLKIELICLFANLRNKIVTLSSQEYSLETTHHWIRNIVFCDMVNVILFDYLFILCAIQFK